MSEVEAREIKEALEVVSTYHKTIYDYSKTCIKDIGSVLNGNIEPLLDIIKEEIIEDLKKPLNNQNFSNSQESRNRSLQLFNDKLQIYDSLLQKYKSLISQKRDVVLRQNGEEIIPNMEELKNDFEFFNEGRISDSLLNPNVMLLENNNEELIDNIIIEIDENEDVFSLSELMSAVHSTLKDLKENKNTGTIRSEKYYTDKWKYDTSTKLTITKSVIYHIGSWLDSILWNSRLFSINFSKKSSSYLKLNSMINKEMRIIKKTLRHIRIVTTRMNKIKEILEKAITDINNNKNIKPSFISSKINITVEEITKYLDNPNLYKEKI